MVRENFEGVPLRKCLEERKASGACLEERKASGACLEERRDEKGLRRRPPPKLQPLRTPQSCDLTQLGYVEHRNFALSLPIAHTFASCAILLHRP
jgi:hypothetical protein